MVVRFCLGSGATFQGAASTWIIGSGQKIATSSQVNSCDTAGALVRVAGLQIEPGAATEYDFVDSDTEIRRCLRWREVLQASSNNFISHAQCIGTTLAIATVQFKNYAPFHFPTLILTAANTFEVMSANNTPITLTAIALELVSANGWEVRCTVASGLVAGNATRLRGGVAGGGKVIITYEQNSLFQPG
jgi:hypothetical protein